MVSEVYLMLGIVTLVTKVKRLFVSVISLVQVHNICHSK